MSLLLEKKYTYPVSGSVDEVKAKLKSIIVRSPLSMPRLIRGTVMEDGTFTFSSGLFYTPATKPNFVYLRGRIDRQSGQTIINIRVSPNVIIVMLIYLMPLIILNIFLGDNSLMGENHSKLNNFLAILFAELAILILIKSAAMFVRWQFERRVVRNI